MKEKYLHNWFEYMIIHYRWVFVILFLLPISFFYEMWAYTRNKVVFYMNSAPHQHNKKVKNVQNQVINWIKNKSKVHMCTGRPGWQMMSFRLPLYKKIYHNININLIDILEINTKNMTVTVEPLVNMGQLTKTLLNLGYTIPVVPEIDDLTVGGLVMGTGIESSSHIYGLFQHICIAFEMVLADGSIITCTKDENSDIFYSIPWSYGTLGFLTAVTISIIPAKKYIRLCYKHTNSNKKTIDVFSSEANKILPSMFIEGIAYNKENAVIMTGDMVDSPNDDGIVNEIGKWHKPWFFMHVKNTTSGQIEYIPLRQYYHRHTKSIFWELQDIIPFGNNFIFRILLGWLMPPKISLLKMTQTKTIKQMYEKHHVIQDMLIPLKHFSTAMERFHDEIEVYPLWLCPFKLYNLPGLLQLEDKYEDHQMYVDIGIYGVPNSAKFETVSTTKSIENFVTTSKGFQMLYADTYTTREEFRKMFDHKLYDEIREKLDCKKAFPEIYDKVNKNVRI